MTVLYDNLDINREILLDLPFREGRGIITQDVAKPHHPITLHNTPTWTTLDSGLTVLTLNGTNQYLRCLAASCVDLDLTSEDYSLAQWINLTSGGSDDKTLMGRFLVSNNGWELYHYFNGIITLRHHHAAGASLRTGAFSGGWGWSTWYYLGLSRHAGVAQFWRGDIDSFAAVSTTVSDGGLIDPETCNQNLFIGTDTTGVNDYYGMMWRPKIWGSRYLSEADHRCNWERGRRWFA